MTRIGLLFGLLPLSWIVAGCGTAPGIGEAQDRWIDLTHALSSESILWPTAECLFSFYLSDGRVLDCDADGVELDSSPQPGGDITGHRFPCSVKRIPCIFPAEQGSAPRDQFAPDSPHRHTGCGYSELSTGLDDGSGEARDLAGCWRPGSVGSEPGTDQI
jgi:hypothetical protein